MSLAFVVYLIGLLTSLSVVSVIVFVVSLIIVVASILVCLSENYDLNKKLIEKTVKWVLIPTFILSIILPSKTDMYIMTGLIVGERILTSEKGNEIVDKSYLYVLSKIDEVIEEQAKGKDIKDD